MAEDRSSFFRTWARRLPLGALILTATAGAHAESPGSLARKGLDLYQHERYPESAEAYRQALARDPSSPVLQYNLGTALAQQHQTDEAAQALAQATQAAPGTAVKRADTYYNLGVALADSGQPSTATVASAAAPGAGALAQGQVKRLEQSLEAFRNAILTDPKEETAKYNYEVVQEMLRRAHAQQQQQQQNQQNKQKNDSNSKNKQNQNQQDQQQQDQNQSSQNQQNQQQNQQQQNQGDQQKQNPGQEQGLGQATPTPTPGPGQSPPQGGSANSGEGQSKPMTPEQMDAMRLLNLLEQEKPEQFKQLFRFQGKRQEHEPLKDW